ncbi:MAG: hypothetical protein LC104_01650 [Bacteroidales bacterium]|nr:hypothetical protein [Bacteroidales bacterium]
MKNPKNKAIAKDDTRKRIPPIPAPEVEMEEEEIEEEEMKEGEWLSDDGYDYTGALCSNCEQELDRNGYCANVRCRYAECRQDEPVPQSAWEREQLVGNPRSKKAYFYGTAGYRRNIRSPSCVVFEDEDAAWDAGYEIRDC